VKRSAKRRDAIYDPYTVGLGIVKFFLQMLIQLSGTRQNQRGEK